MLSRVGCGWRQQLGNLASTLARISMQASSAQYDALVADLLREAALQAAIMSGCGVGWV